MCLCQFVCAVGGERVEPRPSSDQQAMRVTEVEKLEKNRWTNSQKKRKKKIRLVFRLDSFAAKTKSVLTQSVLFGDTLITATVLSFHGFLL